MERTKFTIEIKHRAITNTLLLNGREYIERWTEKNGILMCLTDTIEQALQGDDTLEDEEIQELIEAIEQEDIQAIFDALGNLE